MVGDYYDDSSVEENLNLLLRLTRVEAIVDLKDKGKGFLKGVFKSEGCWGLPQQLLATIGCLGSSRTKVVQGSVHSKVAQRLREIQRQGRFK